MLKSALLIALTAVSVNLAAAIASADDISGSYDCQISSLTSATGNLETLQIRTQVGEKFKVRYDDLQMGNLETQLSLRGTMAGNKTYSSDYAADGASFFRIFTDTGHFEIDFYGDSKQSDNSYEDSGAFEPTALGNFTCKKTAD